MDLSDLSDTRIFLDFNLPVREAVYAGDSAIEGVKEWVLDAAMRQNISQEVSQRACANCGTQMFAGMAVVYVWFVLGSFTLC